MKRDRSHQKCRFPDIAEECIRNLLLHPDDIGHMIRAFKARHFEVSILKGDTVRTGHQEFSFSLRRNFPEMQITGYSEKFGIVSVRLKGGDARIRARGSFVARELQHELTGFLNSRRSIRKRIFSWEGWPFVSIFAIGAEFVLHFLAPVRHELPRLLHAQLWFVACLWPVSVLLMQDRNIFHEIMWKIIRTAPRPHMRR
jgi:hypothetical protein